MQIVAATWYAYKITGSATSIGLLSALALGPAIVGGPIGGALADRFDPRRLAVTLYVFQAVPATVMAVMDLVGDLAPGWPDALVFAETNLTQPLAHFRGRGQATDAHGGPGADLVQRAAGARGSGFPGSFKGGGHGGRSQRAPGRPATHTIEWEDEWSRQGGGRCRLVAMFRAFGDAADPEEVRGTEYADALLQEWDLLPEELTIATGMTYKTPGPDGVIGESIDAIISLVDMIYVHAQKMGIA